MDPSARRVHSDVLGRHFPSLYSATMEPGTRTLEDPLAEALRIVAAADRDGLLLRLMGGMAVRAHAPEWTHRTRRVEVDLDFATRSKDRKAVYKLLEREGYTPDKRHNAMFGQHQGYFVDEARRRPVDVLVDKLEMCHRIEFADRLAASRPTLPLADLLLSKLQIVKINRKDVLDALVLLAEHPLAQDDGAADSEHGQGAISLPRILAHHLERLGLVADRDRQPQSAPGLPRHGLHDGDLDVGARPVHFTVHDQVTALSDAIEKAPKSTRWKLRSAIGERQQWYVEPEEVGHN